jgi:hypothetical protein
MAALEAANPWALEPAPPEFVFRCLSREDYHVSDPTNVHEDAAEIE